MANQGPNLRGQARKALFRVERAIAGVLPRSVDAGLGVLARGIETRAPIDEGSLRRSVIVGPAKTARNWTGGAVIVVSDHAAAVEFGTSNMPAQPFVRPTADQDGPAAARTVLQTLKRSLT